MHVRDIQATVSKVKGFAVKAGGFIRRRKQLTVAVVVAALLVGPLLLTGDGEVFVLNAVGLGLGFGALLLRRFVRPRGRQRSGRARQTQRQQATRAQSVARSVHEARRLRQTGDIDGALAVFAGVDAATATTREARWAYAEWTDLARRRFGGRGALVYSQGTGRRRPHCQG